MSVVEELLRRGADPNILDGEDSEKITPLQMACIDDTVDDTVDYIGVVKLLAKQTHLQSLGMVLHKMSLITIFGHKLRIKNFIKKFDIFQEKISTAFGFWVILGIKFLILKQKYFKND